MSNLVPWTNDKLRIPPSHGLSRLNSSFHLKTMKSETHVLVEKKLRGGSVYTPNMFEENIRKLSLGEGNFFTDFMYEIVEKHVFVLKVKVERRIKSPQQKHQHSMSLRDWVMFFSDWKLHLGIEYSFYGAYPHLKGVVWILFGHHSWESKDTPSMPTPQARPL